jgi:hypothetical protein
MLSAMLTSKLFKPMNVLVFLGILIIAAASYAFTAANTVPDTEAGAGAGAISGYTISNVSYTLDSTTPTELDAVSFDVSGNADPNTVKVQLDSSGGTWYDCTAGTSPSWSCTITDTLLVENMDTLNVVAIE